MWFGQENSGNYDTGERAQGYLTSKPFSLVGYDNAYLELYHWRYAEYQQDKSRIQIAVDGGSFETIMLIEKQSILPWQQVIIDLEEYLGESEVQLRFYFDTYDKYGNSYRGWLVDDIKIYSETLARDLNLTSPSSGVSLNNGTNTFEWESFEEHFGTVNYTFQISASSSFSSLIFQNTTINETTGLTNTSVYLALEGGTYYWRVKATWNEFSSKWSEIRSFKMPGGTSSDPPSEDEGEDTTGDDSSSSNGGGDDGGDPPPNNQTDDGSTNDTLTLGQDQLMQAILILGVSAGGGVAVITIAMIYRKKRKLEP